MAAQHDSLLASGTGSRFPCWNSVKRDIKAVLCQEYNLDDGGVIHVAKRNKQLECGDFLVIIPSLRSPAPTRTSRSRVQSKSKNGACGDVTRTRGADVEAPMSEQAKLQHIAWEKVHGIQVREATRSKNGEIIIHLDRPAMFKAALEKTLPQRLDRGDTETKTAVVNSADAPDLSSEGDDITLCQLRTLLLSQHVSNLMQANGYNTVLLPCGYSEKYSTQLQECGLQVNGELHRETFLTEYSNTQQELMQKINCSCYLYSPDVTTEEPISSTKQIASQTCSRLLPGLGGELGTPNRTTHHDNRKLLDLHAFMEQKKCVMLPKGFDKNLQLANVGSETDLNIQLCALEQQVKLVQSQGPQLTIHVVSSQHSFRQQQVDMAWRILSKTTAPTCQVHLVHGEVTSGGTSFHQLFTQRRTQMERAATLKYGDMALELQWKEKITALTMVGIQFQFLMTSCKHQVKLGGCDNVYEIQHLPGVFVMYNYARLVSLLANFDMAVSQGTYPALPDVKDVDFGVLTDEVEWTLLFNYVLSLPSVVMETISSITPNQLKADIQSHKICHFLHDLCRDLSSYYNRVRVLAKPQPKLLPAVYARIHLLHAVEQVMHDGLALLNIQPISEL